MRTNNTNTDRPYTGSISVSGTGTGGGGGREDCWSEEASATLIEAWGDRYLQLNRGNLRQKDWKEVSDVVNERHDDGVKPRRSDVQCKNRIDTIKKKYKSEKAKPGRSEWRFYDRLDYLIGSTPTAMKITPPGALPSAGGGSGRLVSSVPLPAKSATVTFTLGSNPNAHAGHAAGGTGGYSEGGSKVDNANKNIKESSDEDEDEDEEEEGEENEEGDGVGVVVGFGGGLRKCRKVDGGEVDGEAFKDLANAITKFGKMYERIESKKQEQVMELEKQRMEFLKDLEFKRMQMFMEAQLDLAKMKRRKYSPGVTGETTG